MSMKSAPPMPSQAPVVDLDLTFRNVVVPSGAAAVPVLNGVTFKQRSDPTRVPFNVITPSGICINFDAEGYYTSACDEVTEYLRTEWKNHCDEIEMRTEPTLVEHIKGA